MGRGASGGSAQDDPRSGERGYSQVLISFPFIQKETALTKPRTITFGWIPLPPKPLRNDWRTLMLYRGVLQGPGEYGWVTPNYPKPREKAETYRLWAERTKRPTWPLEALQVFGPSIWAGAPEYAEWGSEWRTMPSSPVKSDPNSHGWGVICPNSSGANLYFWMLDRYVHTYAQRGVWVDCMGNPTCNSEMHGCGWVDENGRRQPSNQILASRRYYERLWNVLKTADPKIAWVKYHDWSITPWLISFADDNYIGEGLIGPLIGTPEKNYYRVVTFLYARLNFVHGKWGMLNGWLTELGTTVANNDPAQRAGIYGKLVTPPKDGKRGEWTLPRWRDYEHMAGLGLLHDMSGVGGNDLPLPWMWSQELERQMHWDDHVRFIGYWELGDKRHPSPYPLPQGERRKTSRASVISSPLGGEEKGEGNRWIHVEGGIPEKIACSVYYRPAGVPKPDVPELDPEARLIMFRDFRVPEPVRAFLRNAGDHPGGWLILVPMNNTDEDVTLTLRPNLAKLGFPHLANGRALDLYRSFSFEWWAASTWKANNDDPESPHFAIQGREESFPVKDGMLTVTVPKRSFRMLLLQSDAAEMRSR